MIVNNKDIKWFNIEYGYSLRNATYIGAILSFLFFIQEGSYGVYFCTQMLLFFICSFIMTSYLRIYKNKPEITSQKYLVLSRSMFILGAPLLIVGPFFGQPLIAMFGFNLLLTFTSIKYYISYKKTLHLEKTNHKG